MDYLPEKNINNKYASTNRMISTGNKINPILHASEKLFNEFLSLEEPPEVEDLPYSQE